MATKTVSEITVNNIRIGGKAPTAIYKGSTEVKEVKKGSTTVYKKEDVVYTLETHLLPNYVEGNLLTDASFIVKSFKGSSTSIPLTTSNVSVTSGTAVVKSVAAHATLANCYTITASFPANHSTGSKSHVFVVTQPTSGLSITVTVNQSGGYYQATIYWTAYNNYTWGLFSGLPTQTSNMNIYSLINGDTTTILFAPGDGLSVNSPAGGVQVEIASGSFVYAYYITSAAKWVLIGSFTHNSLNSYIKYIP